MPNPHFDQECEHLEKRLLNLIHEAKEDRSNLKVTMKKEIEEELDTFKSDVLQPLKKMEETLAFMIKKLTRRINLEAQSITLRSEGAMKILEVITFGNDVGGVKEVEDGIIGDDLDEMEKGEGF
nr:hypothetical protein Iba_chr11aCG13680 [Ipomoea batatas]